ncbi:hypothetical protein ACHWQZ_G003368 [Mnemiopsis leidyi]
MKLLFITLLLATQCQCNLLESDTLLKLSDILRAMNLEEMVQSSTAHKIGASFFKYYSNDLLPLQFQLWKEHVGRNYENGEEHTLRQKAWSDNVKLIHEHNQLNKSYSLAMNHFGDLTPEEYKAMLGTKINLKGKVGVTRVPHIPDLPASVDWRQHGYVTPVKNQGQCGSCWAFSSTGALEGANFRAHGKLVSLSEQNLVDCSSSFGNYGCNGGLMDNAFKYVISNGGLDTEESYPYEGEEMTCRFNANNTAVKVRSFSDVSSGSEDALKAALANNGPVSIAIDASHYTFQFYNGGVYDEPECSSENLDHGVLAVGYGTSDEGQDFWIVKNSWSENWGVQGYVMMSRNKENQCGVASAASFPVAA